LIKIQRKEGSMLRITKATNGEVVLTLSGRMDAENVAELRAVLEEAESHRKVLDLKDLTLVDRYAVSFLARCEKDRIAIRNCPPYIREWITREGSGS
jgi:anti-anti-sigma regulatory factor